MASRSKKKYQFRTEQQHAQLRAGEAGTYDVQILLGNLVTPDAEFYCNTARLQKRSACAQFIYGQLHPFINAVERAVVVELPYRSIRPLASTFDAPGFRERLRLVSESMAPMDPLPPSPRGMEITVLGAHVARILVNDFAGVVDFYEMEPRIAASQPVNPVIRVKSLPSVTRWFVEQVEQLVLDLDKSKTSESTS